MFFEDIAIIYDSNILEYSQSFKSSWVEQEMLDANSDVNVFEYYDEYVKCALIFENRTLWTIRKFCHIFHSQGCLLPSGIGFAGNIHYGPGVVCGLSLLLVLVLAPRVFLWVLWFSTFHINQHFLTVDEEPLRGNATANSHYYYYYYYYYYYHHHNYGVVQSDNCNMLSNTEAYVRF